MDQYKTNPWLIASVALVASLAGATAVYFWKPAPEPSPLQQLTIRENVAPLVQDDQTTETTAYRNEKFGISLVIPDGYRVVEHDTRLNIVKMPSPQDETPMPDLTVSLTAGNQEYVLDENEQFETAEDFSVNGIPGKRYKVTLKNPGPNMNYAFCDFYRFAGTENRAYEFRLWECLESPIFDQVVKSIKLLK
jgi:hypothetical protein